MKRPLNPLLIIYQIFVFLPIMVVATTLTSIITILFSYIKINQNLKTIPPRLWSKLACYLSLNTVSVVGLENIDPNNSYVFVSNHQSAFDIWLIYGWIKNPFSWIMKKELRKMPLIGFACEAAGHIFIDRSNIIAAKKSIEVAEKKLSKGNCIVIFPEGTRSPDGKVGTFKRGAFSIAADINLPIVPITIIGAYERLSRRDVFIRPGKMKMIIHEPIENTANLSEQETRKLANEVREIVISGFSKN